MILKVYLIKKKKELYMVLNIKFFNVIILEKNIGFK